LTFHGLKAAPAVWTVQGYGLALLTFLTFFPGWSHAWEVLFVTLLLTAGCVALLDGESPWVRTPIDLPVALFAGWVLLTVPFATDAGYSLVEWRKLIAKLLAFYWALLVLKHDWDGVMTRRLLVALALGAAVMSVYAGFNFVERGGSLKDRLWRAAAPASDYNWLSTYMIIVLPIIAALAMTALEFRARIAFTAVLALGVLAQFLSYTRAGWLGTAIEVFAFGWLVGRRKLAVGFLAASLVFSAGLWWAAKIGYQQFTVSTETWDYRVAVWQRGVSEILMQPLVGYGYGNDTFPMRFGGHPLDGGPSGLLNLFLMVALGSGIPALAFLLWVFGATVLSLVKRACQEPGTARSWLMIGVAVMVLGMAVRNMFDYMFAGSLAYLYWIVTATGFSQKAPGRGVA
jgi:putative inorganic carbon (HCO3(-)) transporter